MNAQIEIFSISHNTVLETEHQRVIADLEATTEELKVTSDLEARATAHLDSH